MKTQKYESETVQRRFIRHPSRVPIRYELQGDAPRRNEYLRNVGEGGLCFASQLPLDVGAAIRLTIPLLGQQHSADATVAWCRSADSGYEVGVRFITPQDEFCVRMVEQLCYIEEYRARVEHEEGRQLTSEQAATEWIERFAADFPSMH